MRPVSSIAILLVLIFSACSSKKKEAEALELSKPSWVKSRPVSTQYFYGIGISPKVGGVSYYSDKAKEKALSDLSGQISTQIKSEQTMYRMEDNRGVYEYLQSRVKATSDEFLEAYELVDEWEDLSNYYAFYRLSKSEFYALKAQRKEEALSMSYLKLQEANKAVENRDVMLAIEQSAAAIDAISAYLNEETSVDTEVGKIDLFEESKKVICNLIAQLELQFKKEEIKGESSTQKQKDGSELLVMLSNTPAAHIPVRFNYSGGFLITDKYRSDSNGLIALPDFQNSNNTETLKVKVDLQSLGRTVTRNLIVRQLIEKQKASNAVLNIEPAE